MDNKIDHVVAEYFGTREPLVEGKGEVGYIAGVGESGFLQKIIKISIGKNMGIIIVNGRIKGIRIDNKPYDEEEKTNDTMSWRISALVNCMVGATAHVFIGTF